MTATEREEFREAAERCKSLGLISVNPPPEIPQSNRAYERKDGIRISTAIKEFIDAWGDEEFWSGDVLDWIRANRREEVTNTGFSSVSDVLKRMLGERLLTVRRSEPKQNGHRTGKTGNRRMYRRVK